MVKYNSSYLANGDSYGKETAKNLRSALSWGGEYSADKALAYFKTDLRPGITYSRDVGHFSKQEVLDTAYQISADLKNSHPEFVIQAIGKALGAKTSERVSERGQQGYRDYDVFGAEEKLGLLNELKTVPNHEQFPDYHVAVMKHSADQTEVANSLQAYYDLKVKESPFLCQNELSYLAACYSHQAGLQEINAFKDKAIELSRTTTYSPADAIARHQAEFSPPEIAVEVTKGSTKKDGMVAYNVAIEKGKNQSHSQWEKTAKALAENLEGMGLEASSSKGRVYVQAPEGSFAQKYLDGARDSGKKGKGDGRVF